MYSKRADIYTTQGRNQGLIFNLNSRKRHAQNKAYDTNRDKNVYQTQVWGAKAETSVTGSSDLAIGTIVMFTGSIAPTNWHLCDGSTYTYEDSSTMVIPDLQNRFIIGSGSTFASGDTGGSLTISADNLPAHTHSGTVDAVGNHTHGAQCLENTSFSLNTIKVEGSQQQETVYTPKTGNTQTGGIGTHTHGIVIGEAGGHGHEFTGGVNTTENTNYYPPYYALAYIVKVLMYSQE